MECNERTRKFNRGRRTWDRTFAEILTWRTFVITFTPIIFFLYLRIFLVSSLKLKFSKLNTACCHQLRDFLTWSQLLVVGCSFNEHWGPKRPMGRDGTVGRYSYLSHPPHIFCRVEKKKKTEPTDTDKQKMWDGSTRRRCDVPAGQYLSLRLIVVTFAQPVNYLWWLADINSKKGSWQPVPCSQLATPSG